jgi:hypothetical protein
MDEYKMAKLADALAGERDFDSHFERSGLLLLTDEETPRRSRGW